MGRFQPPGPAPEPGATSPATLARVGFDLFASSDMPRSAAQGRARPDDVSEPVLRGHHTPAVGTASGTRIAFTGHSRSASLRRPMLGPGLKIAPTWQRRDVS